MAQDREIVKHLASKKPVRSLAMGEFPVSNSFSNQKNELAEVLSYSPRYNTYAVKTRGAPGNASQPPGQRLIVPRKVENPNVVAPLERGTVVIINWGLGFPYIDGVLAVNASKDTVENGSRKPPNLNRTGKSPANPNDDGSAGYYRFAGLPDDAVAGDWAAVTPDGNYLAALQGKECTMYGSEKAQVSAFGNEGLVRTICEQFEHLSSLGVCEIKNEGGRSNLKFRAAADQLTEGGGSEEQWTFHLDIGDKGDFFDMRVTSAAGATLSRIYLSSDGRIEIMGVNGVNITNAGKSPRHEIIGGDAITTIKGKLTELIDGVFYQKVSSSRVAEISEDERRSVGHNETTSINNHQVLSVGGNQQITVTGGDPLLANPLNVAVMMKVLNGSYTLDIGNELDGSSPAAMAGYNVFIHNGEITMGQDPSPLAIPAMQAFVSLNTLMPNSVGLGGTANPASTNPALLHACVFEAFALLMSTMISLLDSHTHPTAWGPSGPANAPTPAGFASALSSMVPNVQSIRVAIGA